MKTRNYNYDRNSLKKTIQDIKFDIGSQNYLNVIFYESKVKNIGWYDESTLIKGLNSPYSTSSTYNYSDVEIKVERYQNNELSKLVDILEGFERVHLSKRSLKRINRFLWNFQNKPNTHRYLKLIRFVSYVNNISIKIDFDGKEKDIQRARKAFRESIENLKKDNSITAIEIMKEKKELYLKEKGDYYKNK